jgi:hypothetical protein
MSGTIPSCRPRGRLSLVQSTLPAEPEPELSERQALEVLGLVVPELAELEPVG